MPPKWSQKLRVLRRPHGKISQVKKKPAAKPSYVPSSQKVDDDKTLRDVVWANTDVVLEDLLVQRERQLLTSLYKSGHMSKPEVCTHCLLGKVGHLLFQREKWQFRCSSKHCHKYILPVSTSKVFSSRTGLKE